MLKYTFALLQESSVLGPTGLLQDDVVTSLNECTIKDTLTWKKCLLDTLQNPTPGYCISAEFVREHDESVPGNAHFKRLCLVHVAFLILLFYYYFSHSEFIYF